MATEAKAEQTKLLADKLRESSDEDEHEGRREREAFRADRRMPWRSSAASRFPAATFTIMVETPRSAKAPASA